MQSMTENEDGSKKDEGGAEKTSVENLKLLGMKLDGIRAFNRKPKEIRDYLDRFVIKQEQAKRVYQLLFAIIIIISVPALRILKKLTLLM